MPSMFLKPGEYRPDIDGLRAFAIMPILLSHCGIPGMRGGFVGVDVFFVISGFLITCLIKRDIDAGYFSYSGFYKRRAVRILPAFWVMALATLAAGCLLLLPPQLKALGASTVASGLFYSNIHFFLITDYFSSSSDVMPLIHTWSLAVEEQFYLIFPPILGLIARFGPQSQSRIVAVLAAVSFLIGLATPDVYSTASFFLLPARMWELLVGALIAYGAMPEVYSPRARNLLAIAGLGMIVGSCVVISRAWPFPVPFALPPVLGAALLIAYGKDAVTSKLVASLPLRAIGWISYSLYLWHRPLIAFYKLEFGETLSIGSSLLLVCTCFLVAAASYLLIERPAGRMWRPQSDRKVLWTAGAGLLLLTSFGTMAPVATARIDPLPPAAARAASFLDYANTKAQQAQFGVPCFTLTSGLAFDRQRCLSIDQTRPNVLLLGDSHAAQFAAALRRRFPHAHVLQATAAGCRPLLDAKGPERCQTVMALGLDPALLARVNLVVVSARWLEFEVPQFEKTMQLLKSSGRPFIILGPLPEYDIELPSLAARAVATGDWSQLSAYRRLDRVDLDRRLSAIAKRDGLPYFSVVEALCNGQRCKALTSDGTPIQFDHSHFTSAGAKEMLDKVFPASALPPLSH